MKKLLKIFYKILKISGVVFGIALVVFIGFLIYQTVTYYEPPLITKLKISNNNLPEINRKELTFLTWNIGYCGLGKEQDFFMDGGKNARPSAELYQKYLNGVFNTISNYDSVDFILIQEIDEKSKRSYYLNQIELMQKNFPAKSSVFAYNYKSNYVPVPIFWPLGYVRSGMMILSNFKYSDAERYGYTSSHPWPVKLFQLKRCFILSRFKTDFGNELVLINTHNSAYADESSMRDSELLMLRNYMLYEYEMGNFVVVGGDWNLFPPGYFNIKYDLGFIKKGKGSAYLRNDFFPPEWNICSDKSLPTNREVVTSFNISNTPASILDFFVVSPNIESINVKTIPLLFENSDHQPVYLKIKLSETPCQRNLKQCDENYSKLIDSIGKKHFGKSGAKKTDIKKQDKKKDYYKPDIVF